MKNKCLLLAVAALLLATTTIRGAELHSAPPSSRSLEERWQWAVSQAAGDKGTVYIGYSIRRLMERGSSIRCGGHGGGTTDSGFTLAEFLSGKVPQAGRSSSVTEAAHAALSEARRQKTDIREPRELAIVFEFTCPVSASAACRDLWLSTVDDTVKLKNIPFYWLGTAENNESLALLTRRYEIPLETGLRHELIAAVALHDEIPVSLAFLADVLKSGRDDDLRSQAAFWLGEKKDDRVVSLLVRTASADRSKHVREQAVFSLSRLELARATSELINLARTDSRHETREKAIFWLSQQAAAQIPAALENIATTDKDLDIREQAVFALSQLPEKDGLPRLARIARSTGVDPRLRKKALFWLGQSASPEALRVITDILDVK